MKAVRNLARAWATNANTSSFASKIPTITEPVNDGVVYLRGIGLPSPRQMKIIPIGLGSSNDGYSLRVIGWNRVQLSGKTDLWVPHILGEFTVLLGAATGVAGSAVLDTELFADTIAPVAARLPDNVIAAGTAINSQVQVISPVNDTVAHLINVSGCEKVEFCFDQTTNTPTCNVLWALL